MVHLATVVLTGMFKLMVLPPDQDAEIVTTLVQDKGPLVVTPPVVKVLVRWVVDDLPVVVEGVVVEVDPFSVVEVDVVCDDVVPREVEVVEPPIVVAAEDEVRKVLVVGTEVVTLIVVVAGTAYLK